VKTVAMPPEPEAVPPSAAEVVDEPVPNESCREPGDAEGMYLYGIIRGGMDFEFGPMGIEGEVVYVLQGGEVGAVVHDCSARPYESSDEETVKRWLLAHQNVIDQAWKQYGVVIPTAFDTIIAAEEGRTPEETLKAWLDDTREDFMAKLDKFTAKAEYGVQVFWDAPAMMETISRENDAVRKLTADIQAKSKGSAYLLRQKLETVMKKELETKADHYFREFYQSIKGCASEVKIEKTKKLEDPARQMIMNLACLLPREESKVLGLELERIHEMACFFVRYTGPWPPYSFA